jgi:cobalt/nickel transport system permease protein
VSYVIDAADVGSTSVPALRLVDPRWRIVAVAIFAVLVVSLQDLLALSVALAVALAAMVHAKLPAGPTLKSMIAMDTFMIFLIVSLPFTTPGDAFWSVWGFPATWQGLNLAAQIGLKANAAVLALLVLVGIMGPVTLGHALARLRVPPMLVHLLLFTVRYIEVLNDEYNRLRIAMRTRGFKIRTNLHSARSIGYLLGMLVIRAFDRSERILKAMKCRGFRGEFPIMDELHFVPAREYAFAGAMVTLGLVLITLEALRVATF